MTESFKRVDLPAGVRVLVLGRAPEALTRVLWGAGLRPVRAQQTGMLWMLPPEAGRS